MSRYRCWKCGDIESETLVMAGIYRTRMCPRCVNIFQEALFGHGPLRALFSELSEAMAIARSHEYAGRAEEALGAKHVVDRVQEQLFVLLRAWCPVPEQEKP